MSCHIMSHHHVRSVPYISLMWSQLAAVSLSVYLSHLLLHLSILLITSSPKPSAPTVSWSAHVQQHTMW